MIQRLDANTTRFLADLRDINGRVERAQREVASGRRINNASDSPEDLSTLFQLRTELEFTRQVRSNLGRFRTEAQAAEQTLQSAVSLMDRAAVLGTQGANGTMSAEDRGIVAGEVEALLEQMAGLARTKVESRYIFSGNADGQPPFTLDLTLDDPVSGYLGGAATREVMHPAGTAFSISKDAEEVFDNPDPDKNVFQAINSLRLALRDNDDDAIAAALERVQSAGGHLNQQLASYGAVQNQISEATEFAYKQELRLETRLSEIEDTDLTEAILELTQARHQQETSLAVKAQNRKISLFNYLG